MIFLFFCFILVKKAQKWSRQLKKHVISTSGSTPDQSWDRVRSGQSYLYKTQGMDSEVFELPESHPNDEETEYRYELVISQEEFMQIAKANKATPVIQLSYALSKAISQLNPNLTQTINANIATDMRAALGYPNTYKNTVKSMILPYRPEDREKSCQEVASLYRGYLQQQKDPDFCKKEANNMVALYEKLDYTQGFKAKQELLSFMEHIKLDTFSISYVGQFVFNENEQYIDSMHLYGSGNIGVAIHMICAAGNFFIDIKQNFKEDTYVQALLQELAELGLQNVQLTGPIAFSTPKDGLPK